MNVLIPSNRGYVYLKTSQIMFCKDKGSYTEVYMYNGHVYNTLLTLKKLTEKIEDASFYRCHRSFLINFDFVTSIKGCFSGVKLNDHFEVPVSRKMKTRMQKDLMAS